MPLWSISTYEPPSTFYSLSVCRRLSVYSVCESPCRSYVCPVRPSPTIKVLFLHLLNEIISIIVIHIYIHPCACLLVYILHMYPLTYFYLLMLYTHAYGDGLRSVYVVSVCRMGIQNIECLPVRANWPWGVWCAGVWCVCVRLRHAPELSSGVAPRACVCACTRVCWCRRIFTFCLHATAVDVDEGLALNVVS